MTDKDSTRKRPRLNFLDSFLAGVATTPERVLFVVYSADTCSELTYGRLLEGAERWAKAFRARGSSPGDVVLIAMPLCDDLIYCFLGSLLIGCTPSFMPPPNTKQDQNLFWSSHDDLFGRLGAKMIATTRHNADGILSNIHSTLMEILTPECVDQSATEKEIERHNWSSFDTPCLQHSSGTTGGKKGILLIFDQISVQIDAYCAMMKIEQSKTIVSWLPLYHDMGFITSFLLPLTTGSKTVLLDPFAWLLDPLVLFDLIAQHRGNYVWLPNFAFDHLVNAAFDDEIRVSLNSDVSFINCSEPCRAKSMDAFVSRFESWGVSAGQVSTCYAMAEAVFALTQSPPSLPPTTLRVSRAALERGLVELSDVENGTLEIVSSGSALPGVEIRILNDRHDDAAGSEIGQIAVQAPFLFDGYHLDADRTAAAFRDGWYLTQDLGFMIDGELFVLGRRDDMLIVLGRNISANEIETTIGRLPGLKPGRVCAFGIDNANVGSQDLVLLVELSNGRLDAEELRLVVRRHIESVFGATPREIVFVEPGWILKSTSGKINRKANYRKYLAGR